MNFVQVVFNSLITAAELGIIAIGLTLTFSLLRFANFAHVEFGVLGAYIAYSCNVQAGLPLGLSILVGALCMGILGALIDRGVFRRMRDFGDITPMVASLGLGIAMRHGVQAIWGPQHVTFDYAIAPGIRIFDAYITRTQIAIIVIVAVAMIGFHVMLKYTRLGKATVTDTPLLKPEEIVRRLEIYRERYGCRFDPAPARAA